MKTILLVCAANDHELSAWTYEGLPRLLNKKAFIAPLPLATIAALTPRDVTVRIWDEHVSGPIATADHLAGIDLVGITAFSSHLRRARKIAALARGLGVPVVIGGPGVTSSPDSCRDDFDVLFIGEAETTWPRFVADWQAGHWQAEYRSAETPDMALSPPPDWSSIAPTMAQYITGGVQVSRGCPFDCEFCGVWQIFGRKMRTKPVEQVETEIRTLADLGMRSVLFCSDNFVGNPKYAKQVLRRLIAMNRDLDRPLSFAAELDITIARDPEMLALLADANFSNLLIGIETPNRDSLVEVRKRQNLKGDLVQTCHTIQSVGVPIDGSIVVGFDHDTPDTVDLVFDFLQEACIPLPKMHMLKAIAGTDLHARLTQEGRVISAAAIGVGGSVEYLDAGVHTNIIPKGMTRVELMESYLRLVERIFAWTAFEARVAGFIDGVTRPPDLPAEDQRTGHAAGLKGCLHAFPPDAVPMVERLVARAETRVPAIVPVVVKLIFRQLFEAGRLGDIRREITEQVALERAAEQRTA